MIVEDDCLLFWIYDKKALNITVKEFIRAAKFYDLKGRNFRGTNVWVWQVQKLRIIFVTEFSLRNFTKFIFAMDRFETLQREIMKK